MDTKAHRSRKQDYLVDENGKQIPFVDDIPLTKNRIAILNFLGEFQDSNTGVLHEVVAKGNPKVSHTRLQHTLATMRKKAGWISCYPSQYQAVNEAYKELVYRLTARGKKLVQKINPHISSSSYFHDWMASHVAASLKITALYEEALKYIDPLDILARVPTLPHPYKFPVKIEWKGQVEEFRLSPDWPVFGLETEKQQNFFLLEIDCDTEDKGENDDIINATILKKIVAYRELNKPDRNGDNAFWHRLKIPNNYVLIVTINKTRERAILEQVKKVCGKTSLFLVTTIDHFRTVEETPRPMTQLWFTGWHAAGYHEPSYLNALPEED